MIASTLLLSLALLPFASAQTNNTAFELEAIQAHFAAADLVPQLIPSINPTVLLTVSFNGAITPGQVLTTDQVSSAPTISVTPANSSVSLTGNYTLIMVDADVAGANDSGNITRHWLVNGETVTGETLTNSSAVAITEYAGPAPASGSGPHRYTILLYQQSSAFTAPDGFNTPNIGVSTFVLNDYTKNANLGAIVGGMYFQVEVGTSTVSVAPTSAVQSNTLASVSSPTGSGTGAGSKPSGKSAASSNMKTSIFSTAAAACGLFYVLA